MRRALSTIITLLLLLLPFGQEGFSMPKDGKLRLCGRVTTIENGKPSPMAGAVVMLKPTGLYSVTDAAGDYSFSNLDEGQYDLHIEMIGYVAIDSTVVLRTSGRVRFDFTMELSSFRLKEVHIVAQSSKAGESTASTISRQAIDHALTSSLGDVMQLLPGVSISNPSLSSAQSHNHRRFSCVQQCQHGRHKLCHERDLDNNSRDIDIQRRLCSEFGRGRAFHLH